VPAACEHAKEELGSQLLAKNVSTPPIAGPLHPTNRSKTTDLEDQLLQAAVFFEHAKLELRDEEDNCCSTPPGEVGFDPRDRSGADWQKSQPPSNRAEEVAA
jgi:hypothetical protein